MSEYHVVEEQKQTYPPILLVDTNAGIKNTLLDLLVEELEQNSKIYVLSQKAVSGKIEKISPLSIHLMDKISDDLQHAVIFLDEQQQKKKVISVIEQLDSRNTKIILLIPYRASEHFIDVLLRCKDLKNVTIGFLGDIFGKSSPHSPLSKIIYNAFASKEVTISGNEVLSIFPVSDTDSVSAILHLLFGIKNPSAFYNIFYSTPQTLISLSHVLKRHEPELSISFGNTDSSFTLQKTEVQMDKFIKERTTILPIHPIQSFQGFEKSLSYIKERSSFSKQTKQKNKRSALKKSKRILGSITTILKYGAVGFVAYVLVIFTLFFFSILFYKNGVTDLLSGNIEKATANLSASQRLYGLSRNTVLSLSGLPFISQSQNIQDSLAAYDDLSKITYEIIPLIQEIKSENPKIIKSDFEKIIQASIGLYFLSERYDIQSLKELTHTNTFQTSSQFLTLFPSVMSALGYQEKKNYLVLFQNNNELRPTGGFIGSVANLSFNKGVVKDIEVQDIFDLDGQLKGHIEPPYIIRRFLQPHLYLRDSNFAPDFEETASTSALLYNLESGKKVDGVIAIDASVLKHILAITGPIQVTSTVEVTKDNVLGLLQDKIENDSFAGSTQKKELLNTLLAKITLDLESNKKHKIKLLKTLPQLVLEKHILFSFADGSTQKTFKAAGFTGSLSDLRVAPHLLKDFLSVNEANIGVNKVNEFVTRKVTYSAFIKPSVLNSDVLVEYANTGDLDYKAYIRFIVPKDAKLLQIEIDSQNQAIVPAVTNPAFYERRGFAPPKGLEVDQEDKGDNKYIGFVVTIPQKKTMRIRVLYENQNIVPKEGGFTYSLFYVKQPGTLPYPLTVLLQEEFYKIQNKSGDNSPVIFDGNIKTDKIIEAKLIEASE